MVRPLQLAAVALLAIAASAFASQDARACSSAPQVTTPRAGLVPRPTSHRGPHAYRKGVRVQRLASANVVVHYTRAGPDALRGGSARDENRNRVPDYVELASAAAEKAIESYKTPGFFLREIVCDTQPDRRADIYLKRGQLGLALEPVRAAEGSFVLISPDLGTASTLSRTSLRLIVAHELFHLVQFAYTPRGMPRWIAEGTANALGYFGTGGAATAQAVADQTFLQNLDSWLKEPSTSMFDSGGDCTRCYGGSAWWLEVIVSTQQPSILHEFFTQLGGSDRVGTGVAALAAAVSAAGDCLCRVFADSVQRMLSGGFPFAPSPRLELAGTSGTTAQARLFGFAIHLVPISVPAATSGVRVAVRWRSGAGFWAALRVGGPGGRDVAVVPDVDPATVAFEATFASAAERNSLFLIVTNSEDGSLFYDVSWTTR